MQKTVSKARAHQKHIYDSKLNDQMFKVGQRVFISYPEVDSESRGINFCPKLRGPYPIISVLEPNIKVVTAKGEMIVHKNRCKIAYLRESHLARNELTTQTVTG
ncbi:hypothetical protein RF11_04813 [Thelohanellus kitauei]|uniref:Uncharacterized protein n=1 Tax=Thelohanellus kitauei TaxID=669202 RepID=A0A0C2I5C3_THEKT|nr:hypothetical protein RF11_04813 [Thelohanellus kitauei]